MYQVSAFRRLCGAFSIASVLTGASLSAQEADQTLKIYWIDVEGGAATLIVTPAQESVLMDAGWNREDNRDAIRIEMAMRDAGVTEIDYFIASHFHGDHVGGLPALAARVPINQYFDHGDSVEQETERGAPAWTAYLSAADGKRTTATPGDTLPLKGVGFTFATSNREQLNSVDGSPGDDLNPYCDVPAPAADFGENSRSVGYMLTLGDFEFLNLGDLTVDLQHTLACPRNRFGVVDLLQVPHHTQGVASELAWALQPTAAVSNNGARKGGRVEDLAAVQAIPQVQGTWQVHSALAAGDGANTEARMTANLTEEDDRGYWIKATVAASGESYRISNARNEFSETYQTK